ncbi:MAG: DMT family transporter [Methyloligellaceae bacterium]
MAVHRVVMDVTETKPNKNEVLPASGLILLGALTIFWGFNWPAMKTVLGELTVWWFRTICLGVGGLGLLLVAYVGGNRVKVRRSDLWPLLVSATLNIVGWHLCAAYGVSLMPAGRAVIIAFTMPVWATLISCWVLNEELTKSKLVGLALGVAGLTVLLGGDLVILKTAPVGAMFMLGAALSWAAGTVAFKWFRWSTSVISIVGWQMTLGAVPITLGALLIEPLPDIGGLSEQAWWALLYVVALPMLFCHWAYFKSVQLLPANVAAIGTLAIPVVGVYSSALLLAEEVGFREHMALVLICAALASVLVVPKINEHRRA